MKIFQIQDDTCYWDATSVFPTLEATNGRFQPDILFVEAPDNVREGWGYIDGHFTKPSPPAEGLIYDEKTGTFFYPNATTFEIFSKNPYHMGDCVIYNDKIYRSLIDNNLFSPNEKPNYWECLSD